MGNKAFGGTHNNQDMSTHTITKNEIIDTINLKLVSAGLRPAYLWYPVDGRHIPPKTPKDLFRFTNNQNHYYTFLQFHKNILNKVELWVIYFQLKWKMEFTLR